MAASTRKRESKQNQKEISENIKQKTKEIIQNRKNINNVIDIFGYLEVTYSFVIRIPHCLMLMCCDSQSDEAPVVQASIKALEKVFCHLISSGRLDQAGPPLESAAEKQVREWTRERYLELQDYLLKLVVNEQVSVQEQALLSLMQLLQAEGQHPVKKTHDGKEQHIFPIQLLEV